jgi:hypothetical protein
MVIVIEQPQLRNGEAGIRVISRDVEKASRGLGAGWWKIKHNL